MTDSPEAPVTDEGDKIIAFEPTYEMLCAALRVTRSDRYGPADDCIGDAVWRAMWRAAPRLSTDARLAAAERLLERVHALYYEYNSASPPTIAQLVAMVEDIDAFLERKTP